MYTLCGKIELKVVGQFRHAANYLLNFYTLLTVRLVTNSW